MKKFTALAAIALCLSLGAQAATEQQNLTATCNAEAAGKKGDERKAYMKLCLSDGKKQQQERAKACNAELKGKKGGDRNKMMSACLKKHKNFHRQ